MAQSDELGPGQGSGQPVGKGTGTQGRGDGQGSDGTSGGGHVGSRHCSPQPASVVIRATVEHIGLVGDTELTVNVKWPASIFCVQPCAKPGAPSGPAPDPQNVPANGPDAGNFDRLYGETTDPTPYIATSHQASTQPTPSASSETSGPPETSYPSATATQETSGSSDPKGSTKT